MRTPRRRSHTDRSAALCARPRLRGGGRSVLPANRRAPKLPPPSRSPIAARRTGPRPPPRSANHKIDTAESQSKGREGTPSLEGPSLLSDSIPPPNPEDRAIRFLRRISQSELGAEPASALR